LTEEIEGLKLTEEEATSIAEEASALAEALSGVRRSRALLLAEAAREGAIPAELIDVLEGLAVLVLQTGRARQRSGAEGERLWTRLLLHTPRGRELREQIAAVNRALQALIGRRLDSVRLEMRTLGHFTLHLSSEGVAITLAVRADGVQIESLSAG
jgi:hypothetical protein